MEGTLSTLNVLTMFPKFDGIFIFLLSDIQSWFEVPSIAHFCSLFRAAFSLVDFDIEVMYLL